MADKNYNFMLWIKDGILIYRQHPGLIFGGGAAVIFGSIITLGVLAGPLGLGFLLVIHRLVEMQKNAGLKNLMGQGFQRTPQLADIWKGFEFFFQAFLCVFVTAVVNMVLSKVCGFFPVIGGLLSMLANLTVGTLVMFALPLVGHKKLDFWTAMLESADAVKQNFFAFLGLGLVGGLIAFSGAIFFGIGIVLTFPVYFTIVARAYIDVFPDAPVESEKWESR